MSGPTTISSTTMPPCSVQTQTMVSTRSQAMQALFAAAAFGVLLVAASTGSLPGLMLAGKALVALQVVSLVGFVFFAQRFFQIQRATRQFVARPAGPSPEQPRSPDVSCQASKRSTSPSASASSVLPHPTHTTQSIVEPVVLTDAANSSSPNDASSTATSHAGDISPPSTGPEMSHTTPPDSRQTPARPARHTQARRKDPIRKTNSSNLIPEPYFLRSNPALTPLQNALCQADLTMGPYQNTRAVLLSASVAPSSNDVLQRIVLDHALATDLHNQEMSSTCSTSHILPRSEAMAGQSHRDNHLDSPEGHAYLHGLLDAADSMGNYDDSTSSSARVSSRPADLAANTKTTRLTTKAGRFDKNSRLAAIADKANRFNR